MWLSNKLIEKNSLFPSVEKFFLCRLHSSFSDIFVVFASLMICNRTHMAPNRS